MWYGFSAENGLLSIAQPFAARVAKQTIEGARHVQQVETGGRSAAFDPEQVR